MGTAPGSEVTEVITTDVKSGNEARYRDWTGRVQSAQAKFPGYKGSFVEPPREGERGWTTFMHFDTAAHLDAWMQSTERAALLAERAGWVENEILHRVDTSFPGWAPNDPATGKPPNKWKTAALVLLTLFPVVMFELKFLTPVLRAHDVSPALATFIGNALSVLLTTWPLMPLAIRAFRPWIFPDPNSRGYVRVVAPVVVAACFVFEVAALWHLLG